jgi:hypothetical protein
MKVRKHDSVIKLWKQVAQYMEIKMGIHSPASAKLAAQQANEFILKHSNI